MESVNTGDQLRRLRESSHLSQSELSERTGLPQGRISRIEGGDSFRFETVVRYANGCGFYAEIVFKKIKGTRKEGSDD